MGICQRKKIRQSIENIAYNDLEKLYEIKKIIKFSQSKQTYLVSDNSYKIDYIMQVIPKRQDNELRYVMSVKHKNIIAIEQIYQTEHNSIIIYKKADAKQLFLFCQDKIGILDLALIKQIFLSIVQVMKLLTDMKIQHQTLSPQKMLLTSDGQLILLGMLDKKRETQVPNPLFEPPEGFFQEQQSEKTNVWICGMLLLILLKGNLPTKFSYLFPYSIKDIKKSKIFDNEDQEISSQARRLLNEMLKENPAERATFHQVVNNPWIIGDSSKVTPRQVSSEQMIKFESNLIESIYIEYCLRGFITTLNAIIPLKDRLQKQIANIDYSASKQNTIKHKDSLLKYLHNEALLISLPKYNVEQSTFMYENFINQWEEDVIKQCIQKLIFCFKNGKVKKRQVIDILQPTKQAVANSLIIKVKQENFYEFSIEEYDFQEFVVMMKNALIKEAKQTLNNQSLTHMISQELQNQFQEVKSLLQKSQNYSQKYSTTIDQVENILNNEQSKKEVITLLQQLLSDNVSKECNSILKLMINKLQL